MEKNAALILLGFDPKSEIEKESFELTLEEAIFTEASFFMLRSFIPKLAEARILRLIKLAEAGDLFHIEFPERGERLDSDSHKKKIEECQKISDLVQIYQQYEMRLKLNISNEENPHRLIHLYKKWISLFSAYSNKFLSLFENLNLELAISENPSISITQPSDYNVLVSELKKEVYTDSVFIEYLRIQKLMIKSS